MRTPLNRNVSGSIRIIVISAASVFLGHALPCQADLASLIKDQRPDRPAVVTSLSGSSDSEYGLLNMPLADFSQELSLTDPSKLENQFFKIVESKGNDVLPTTDFDGNNVLYHLMLARKYYAKLAQNSGFPDEALDPSLGRKLVVRVRMENAYNLVLHFAAQADYDNSRYIPAEAPIIQIVNAQSNPGVAPWQQEIWFDRQKTMTGKVDWYDVASSAGLAVATQSWVSLGATPMEFLNHYNAGIDGEKIPDVIYHEAFHYASDAEGLFVMASEGNPVAEDYANYFGSSLNGRPEIAELEEFSSRAYKRDYSKVVEVKDTQVSSYNANPFGPSVFWQIRNRLGQDRADQLVWNSLHYLNGSSLHADVPKAVSAAAHSDPAISPNEASAIDDLLKKYHQSYVNLELKFNPGAAALQDEEVLKKSASDQADQLKKIPDELQAKGVSLDPDTAMHIADVADGLKTEAHKPGFRSKVVMVLNQIARAVKTGGEDAGMGIGYAGGSVFAAGNAPMTFGTDLVSAIIMGHGMLTGKDLGNGQSSGRDRGLEAELTGAAGGVASTYYSYASLTALGFSSASLVTSSAFGVVFVSSLVCSKASPQGKTSLDHYCVENSKVVNEINSNTAKGGAVIGTDVHKELKKIGQFFRKVFAES